MSETYQAAVIGLGFIGAGDQESGDALGQQVSSLDGTIIAQESAWADARGLKVPRF